jgi:L-alanine-DL-glutamate epimerase-like enolase superfamily enzyme
VFVYAAGGYYHPGEDNSMAAQEMESYLERGYSVVKMKIGGASLADDCERIESVLKILGSQASSSRWTRTAAST